MPTSFTREAEGWTVTVSEPLPRWVMLEHNQGLAVNVSLKEAEGLLYALSLALRDARDCDAA